jgi:hypothetical protein
MPVWNVVQGYIDTRQILSAGLSDFNAKYMEQFMNALEDKNVINEREINSCYLFNFREKLLFVRVY